MVWRQERLDLCGYRDAPVPNRFLRQETPATQGAIVFPGLGYTCEMPLLYYTTALLLNRGCDVLLVDYDYRGADFRQMPAAAQVDRLVADTQPAFDAIRQLARYERISLIAKSLGTRALGRLVQTKHNDSARAPDIRAVWLTPLLRDERLQQQLRGCALPSLTIIGTADPHYDESMLHELAAKPEHEIMTITGADHSLELDGDISGSIRALESILAALDEFLAA
jgi:predicted alpha/beta-hydrolase family hydrolase